MLSHLGLKLKEGEKKKEKGDSFKTRFFYHYHFEERAEAGINCLTQKLSWNSLAVYTHSKV
jgi:hypothetical protein